jgi:hypothetical protein
MRFVSVLVLFLVLLAGSASAQTTAAEKAANLRAQLAEVEAKQTELQARLKSLEEQLKPENIEHSLAGFGSTKPEELREQRRKELEIERNGVQAQLNLLATSHSRLETSIAQADAEAYRQSAAPVPPPMTTSTTTSDVVETATPPRAVSRPRRVRRKRARRVRKSHHVLITSSRSEGEANSLECADQSALWSVAA